MEVPRALHPTSWLGQLLYAEIADRQARSGQYPLRLAKFPLPSYLQTREVDGAEAPTGKSATSGPVAVQIVPGASCSREQDPRGREMPGEARESGDGQPTAPKASSDVFISYASQDKTVADAVCAALERAGVVCWIAPRDVVPGEFYAGAIVHAIDSAKVIVLVLSENAATSQHVLREVERASSKRHPVVALRIDLASMPAALEYFLNTSHWLDASSSGVERALPTLVDAVRRAMAPADVASSGDQGGASKPVASLSQQSPLTRQASHRLKRPLIVLSVLVASGLGYVAADKLWFSKHGTRARPAAAVAPATIPAAAAISEKSVAVLPFVDMSEKKDQEYFSDGLSEELIDILTKVPDLRVRARTSSFYFKGKQATIGDIAKALSVAHVLEGSVRKSGKTLRITVQLIRVNNGYHVWSETFDRQLTDVFKIQDEIAAAVVKALKGSLSGGETVRSVPTTNAEAYALYLHARAILANSMSPNTPGADAFLEQALRRDPNFAPAWADLAMTRTTLTQIHLIPFEQARDEARAAAERAVALDPNLCAAHVSMARVHHFFDWDWAAADAEIQRALQIDPNDDAALRWAGWNTLVIGHVAEAIAWLQKAVDNDPLGGPSYYGLGMAKFAAGDLRGARVAFERDVILQPLWEGQFRLGLVSLSEGDVAAALKSFELSSAEEDRVAGKALAMTALGRRADADAALTDLERRFANVDPYETASVYAYRGERDRAFVWLDRAFLQHDSYLRFIKTDPLLNNLRADPRYKALLRKMKLLG